MPEAAPSSEPGPRPAASGRLLGRHRGAGDGPLLVCLGGVHGNEPAGVDALRRVLARLGDRRPDLRGEIVALLGNRRALAHGRRYLDEDLNRIWTLERIEALRVARPADSGSGPSSAESAEMTGLLNALREILPSDGERAVYCLDLHTTSSDSVPFLTFSDSLRNRAFARHFPVPLVLGLEEELEGTFLDYVDHLGHVALGVEGGSHGDPASVDHLERAVWLALVSLEMIDLEAVPEPDALRESLQRATGDVPSLFELRYRHALREEDGFRMEPGYRNFQQVEAGEVVARDRRGPVTVPESGRIFLPLYQEKGEEGYFIVRRVARFWLRISAVLRRLGADRLAPLMPGVDPHPEREDTLVVQPWAARHLTLKLFHLLGYRRERPEGGRLVLTRRKEVAEGPPPPEIA